ncbi:MAG TPA: multicopper oxidase domain-containing protein [Anaerolineae bacterium]
MSKMPLTRRAFLRSSGLGTLALLAARWPASALAAPAVRAADPLSVVRDMPRFPAPAFTPDAEVLITAVQKTVSILPGAPTAVWGYEGQLISGSGVTVQAVPGSYLGPILRVASGTKLRLRFANNLNEKSVLHPHGLRVPQECDGQPMQAIDPGLTKIYDFRVIDRAMPAWFHPHPMMRTAYQVAMGLAGLFYVTDAAEALAVPGAATGANDVPVVIQDRTFDSGNQFLYQPNQMWGYLGNRILVNGKPDAVMVLEPRAYRLRLLNGSNARSYKLAWSNNMPLKVIGTDGGLLPAAVSKSYVFLMPGERIDLWVDFSALAGKQVILRSLSFDPGGMMGGGMMGSGGGMGGMSGMGSGLANGAAFNVLTVNVGRTATVKPTLGPLPALGEDYSAANVGNWATPVPFTLAMQQMTWTINGRVYQDMVVANDEMVYRDVPIAWEWINNSPIPHPMHIHDVQFRVVKRTPSTSSSYATVNQGFVDGGWKDTVAVWPGERVKIAMRFGPDLGMYMYHCHILEHEDMGMMRNLMIMDPMMPMAVTI